MNLRSGPRTANGAHNRDDPSSKPIGRPRVGTGQPIALTNLCAPQGGDGVPYGRGRDSTRVPRRSRRQPAKQIRLDSSRVEVRVDSLICEYGAVGADLRDLLNVGFSTRDYFSRGEQNLIVVRRASRRSTGALWMTLYGAGSSSVIWWGAGVGPGALAVWALVTVALDHWDRSVGSHPQTVRPSVCAAEIR